MGVQNAKPSLLGSAEIRDYSGLQAATVTGCWRLGGHDRESWRQMVEENQVVQLACTKKYSCLYT